MKKMMNDECNRPDLIAPLRIGALNFSQTKAEEAE